MGQLEATAERLVMKIMEEDRHFDYRIFGVNRKIYFKKKFLIIVALEQSPSVGTDFRHFIRCISTIYGHFFRLNSSKVKIETSGKRAPLQCMRGIVSFEINGTETYTGSI